MLLLRPPLISSGSLNTKNKLVITCGEKEREKGETGTVDEEVKNY